MGWKWNDLPADKKTQLVTILEQRAKDSTERAAKVGDVLVAERLRGMAEAFREVADAVSP